MNRRIAILAVAAALTVPAAARAETKVGLGIGFEPFALVSSLPNALTTTTIPPVSFYVPIDVIPQLRIEPSFGYWHLGANRNLFNPYSVSLTSLGVGGFYRFSQPAPVGFYAGARFTFVFNTASTFNPIPGTTTDVSETDIFFAPTLGAEYAPSPHFSLGTEFQLRVAFYGNPSTTGAPTPALDRSGFSTAAVIFLRYFF